MMPAPPTPPPPMPRPAATLLVLRDDPFEVLMVSRHADQDFSSALVFPGGTVDASDADEDWLPHLSGAEGLSVTERALRIAALRETFEECGLLLARRRDGAALLPPDDQGRNFRRAVAACDAVLALDDLVPFAHWITPEVNLRRYDTHFFLIRAPAGQLAHCDGSETVAVTWVNPAVALAQAREGRHKIVFPTRLNLGLLGRNVSIAQALAAARDRTIITVMPRIEKRVDGIAVVIPADAGYDQTEELRPTR